MKKFSLQLLSETIVTKRKALELTQAQVAERTGMNRSMLSKLESQDYTPSIDQLQALADVFQFEPETMFIEPEELSARLSAITANIESLVPAPVCSYKITVAGTGYVGLSLAVLLAQHNEVTAVDIISEKVEKLNNYIIRWHCRL